MNRRRLARLGAVTLGGLAVPGGMRLFPEGTGRRAGGFLGASGLEP